MVYKVSKLYFLSISLHIADSDLLSLTLFRIGSDLTHVKIQNRAHEPKRWLGSSLKTQALEPPHMC